MLGGVLAGHADHHPGMRQVVAHQHGSDGHKSYPRISNLTGKGVGNDLAQGLAHLLGSARRPLHRNTVTVSTMRTPSVSSTSRSAAQSVPSTTERALPTAAQAISARCHKS